MGISDVWYRNAIVYAVDVGTYLDSDGDGIGDFRGLTARLGYLQRQGVACLWVLPFYPSPGRDNGYDVMDFYGVDPKLGTPGDFVEFLHEARGRGMHVILDLVVNHTSDEHPWFQSAQASPDSPFRDFYVWTDEPPPEREQARPVFPRGTESVWTWSERAGAYYLHHFYAFEPGLNLRNPAVREEIRRILGYWLELGVSGFRVDAAPFLVWPKGPAPGDPDHSILRRMHRFSRQRRADAVLIAEANVEPDALGSFFGDGDEMQLLFEFLGCSHLFLALARGEAAPIAQGLKLLPPKPEDAQWLRFLRNQGRNAVRRECPEFGLGEWQVLDAGDAALFAHRCEWAGGVTIAVHNLSREERTARLDIPGDAECGLLEVAADAAYAAPEGSPLELKIGGYGYRWFRVGGVMRAWEV